MIEKVKSPELPEAAQKIHGSLPRRHSVGCKPRNGKHVHNVVALCGDVKGAYRTAKGVHRSKGDTPRSPGGIPH